MMEPTVASKEEGDRSMAAMLTTVDNPYDPRTDFRAWYAWDLEQGYFTCALLARISLISEDFPKEITDIETERAIDELIELHDGGFYKKLEVEAA